MTGEAFTKDLEGTLDATSKVAQRPRALLLRFLGPLLKPAAICATGLPRSETGCMGCEPEEDEVGVDLAREHGLEVELEEGLAREGLVIAQDTQVQAV